MTEKAGLDRRTFIRNAGLGALSGAAAALTVPAREAVAQRTSSPAGGGRDSSGRFDFDRPYNRVGSNCSRWDSPARRYPGGEFRYGMGVATMDFECAPCITEALEERIRHHSWGYLSNTDDLSGEIVKWNGEYHDLDIDASMVTLSDGVYPGLIAALRSLVPAGDKVLLATPSYSGFYTITRHARVEAVDSPMLYRDGRYEIDWNDLETRMTPDVRAMIVCNPQNPTGNVWTQEELLRIGRLCLEHKIVVLADEIHSDFVRRGHRYVPFASLPDDAVVNNSVSFNAISKTFNLPGMKNAYYYSRNPQLRARVDQFHRADLSTLGVTANIAAYRDGREWFEQANAYIDESHNYVERRLKERLPAVGYTRNEGTFMTFLDFSKVMAAIGADEEYAAQGYDTPEEYFQDWLVHHSGVYLSPGPSYGAGGEGHMRMNVASSRLVLDEVFEAMAGAIDKVV